MKVVFFDVDTQLDFLYPAGALFVPGAQHLVASFSALARFGSSKQIQIISTIDAHLENDPEFRIWKSHCVMGTVGQTKAAGTLLARPITLATGNESLKTFATATISSAPQIIVEKQQLDPFTNPNLTPLLELLKVDLFIVYGVATEYCVGSAALGLLQTGARVELIEDAIKGLSPADERDLIERFLAKGGELTNLKSVLAEVN